MQPGFPKKTRAIVYAVTYSKSSNSSPDEEGRKLLFGEEVILAYIISEKEKERQQQETVREKRKRERERRKKSVTMCDPKKCECKECECKTCDDCKTCAHECCSDICK